MPAKQFSYKSTFYSPVPNKRGGGGVKEGWRVVIRKAGRVRQIT